MSYAFTAWGLPDIAIGILFLFVSYAVYRANPEKLTNRVYALLALLWAFSRDFAGAANSFANDPSTALAWQLFAYILRIAGTSLTVYFVTTFPGRHNRLSRNRNFQIFLLVTTVAAALVIVIFSDKFLFNPIHYWGGWGYNVGWAGNFLQVVSFSLVFIGLSLIISQYLSTKYRILRKQLAYTTIGIAEVTGLWVWYTLLYTVWYPNTPNAGWSFDLEGSLYLGLMAYAILKYQLFDIDIKIKQGVKYSILLAIFFGIVISVEQLLQQYVTQSVGSIIGVVLGAIIVVTGIPLQKMAEAASSRVFKGVSDNDTYLQWKRMEIYKAALIGALSDQEITERERRILEGLREKLDLSEGDVAKLKEDLLTEKARGRGSQLPQSLP